MVTHWYLLCTLLLLLRAVISAPDKVYTGPVPVNRTSSGQRYGDIVLAGLFPIHQNENGKCGQILDLGVQRQEAMVFAIQRINNDHTLLPNVTLGFDIRDTCVNHDVALEHSLDFLNVYAGEQAQQRKGISGVIGAASSQVSIYVANLLRLFMIPQISYASTARVLSDKSRYEYFLRTLPPDSQQAQAMAELIYHHNWTYISMIHTTGAYGRDGIEALKDELDKLTNRSNTTFCTAADIELSLEATKEEYDEAINELVDYEYTSNATVVVIFGQLVTAERILDAFEKKRHLDPRLANKCITWIASDAWGDQIDPKHYPVAHGMISIIPKKLPYQEFDDYFLSLNPTNNNHNPWFAEYWEKQFNCSLTGDSNTPKCDTKKQKLGKNYKQNSKVPFTVDAVYAFAYAIQTLSKKCYQQLCTEIIDPSNNLKGNLLLQALYETTFRSKTKNSVESQFDTNGDVEGEGYGIFNLQLQKGHGANYTYTKVGIWKGKTGLRLYSDTAIEWNHNDPLPLSKCSEDCGYGKHPISIEDQSKCCWKCEDCKEKEVSNGTRCVRCRIGFTPNQQRNKCTPIPPIYLTWDTAWAIITIILCFIGLVTTGSIALLFFVKRKTVIVRRSSQGLSAVLLAGLFLCYIIPMFYISRPSTVICGIQQFTLGIGFNICYSAILIKTNLLFRIFESKQGKNVPLISTRSQLLLTMLLIVIQCAISGIWVVIVPPSTKYTYSENTVELTCAESSSYRNIIVALAYNGIVLVTGTIYALRGRNIPDNYNEAKYINGTLIVTCIIWIVYIPTTIATVPQGAVYQIGSHIMAIIFSATTILAALFFPKVYQIFFAEDQEHPTGLFLSTQHRLSVSHSLSHAITEQRSNESLRSGASSIYSGYQITDRKVGGDGKPSTGSTSTQFASTRRSSVTSIKSFTAILPAVLETVESEPSSSDSTSAINMKIKSSQELNSEGKDTANKENMEVQIVEIAIHKKSSTTPKNHKGNDSSIEITGETEERPLQKLSSCKVDSIPDIQIDKCTDVVRPNRNIYKRRMSKSCDQLDVCINLPNTNGKWKSWSNFLSSITNTVTRVKQGLSNSISHVDQLVDNQNADKIDQLVDNQNDKVRHIDQIVDLGDNQTNEVSHDDQLVDNQNDEVSYVDQLVDNQDDKVGHVDQLVDSQNNNINQLVKIKDQVSCVDQLDDNQNDELPENRFPENRIN